MSVVRQAIRSAKRVVLSSARSAGVYEFVLQSRWRSQRLLILCYHGVSLADEHEWNGDLYVTAAHLRSRCELLRKRACTVMPLDDALRALSLGALPPRAVTITFDDGFHDFYAKALPVLREYEFHATVYLTTYYCVNPKPVFPLMFNYLLWKARGSVYAGTSILPRGRALDLRSEPSFRQAVKDVHRIAAGMSAGEKDRLLWDIAERCAVDYQAILGRRILQLMTSEEVASLPGGLIDVQLHTHRHRTPGSRELFLNELRDNKETLATILGDTAGGARRHFCYPSGATRPQFLPWLREAGVASATTCESGFVSPGSERLMLPRFLDRSDVSDLEFEAWVSGVSPFLPQL